MKRYGLIFMVFFLLASACKTGVVAPTAQFAGHTGCKNQLSKNTMTEESFSGFEDLDCLFYNYDGNSILLLTHQNSMLNCCPSEILWDVSINGSKIVIKEWEKAPDCKCTCPYDLNYTIMNLEPGYYEVNFYYGNDSSLRFSYRLNLTSAVTNTQCSEK